MNSKHCGRLDSSLTKCDWFQGPKRRFWLVWIELEQIKDTCIKFTGEGSKLFGNNQKIIWKQVPQVVFSPNYFGVWWCGAKCLFAAPKVSITKVFNSGRAGTFRHCNAMVLSCNSVGESFSFRIHFVTFHPFHLLSSRKLLLNKSRSLVYGQMVNF